MQLKNKIIKEGEWLDDKELHEQLQPGIWVATQSIEYKGKVYNAIFHHEEPSDLMIGEVYLSEGGE